MIQSLSEQKAWLPPERLSPCDWTSRHRVLPPNGNAEPGRFKWSRTPYLKEIADTINDPNVSQIVVVKGTQVGWSELIRSILGWCIDQEPGPAMLVLPKKDSITEVMKERIRPLIAEPIIAAHLSSNPDDNTKSYIYFDSMNLYTASAESPTDLGARPIRYIFFDEVEKYPPFSGREADPISLGIERTTTYQHRAKVLIGSTPNLSTGTIWKKFEACDDQRCYFVPCPYCRHSQRLVFSNVKWPKEIPDRQKRAAAIERDQSAWYECEKCKGKILEQHKMKMLNDGEWVSGSIQNDGQWVRHEGTKRKDAKRVGYWIPKLYSPWKSFSDLATQFIRSIGDIGEMMNFQCSWLAEPFVDQISAVKTTDISALKHSAAPAKTVPDFAQLLIATVDVQSEGGKPYFYFVIRAWGAGYLSQLVDFGKIYSVEALSELLNTNYPGTSDEYEPMAIDMLGIDGHYLPEIVYDFASTDARITVLIGSKPLDATQVVIKSSKASSEHAIEKKTFDSNFFKNHHEFRRLNGLWTVNDGIDDDYCSQLAAEQKIVDKKTGKHIWVQRSQGNKNHLYDCEIMQHVMADISGVHLLVDESTEVEETETEIEQPEFTTLGY